MTNLIINPQSKDLNSTVIKYYMKHYKNDINKIN